MTRTERGRTRSTSSCRKPANFLGLLIRVGKEMCGFSNQCCHDFCSTYALTVKSRIPQVSVVHSVADHAMTTFEIETKVTVNYNSKLTVRRRATVLRSSLSIFLFGGVNVYRTDESTSCVQESCDVLFSSLFYRVGYRIHETKYQSTDKTNEHRAQHQKFIFTSIARQRRRRQRSPCWYCWYCCCRPRQLHRR
jgi:hypothetical protein